MREHWSSKLGFVLAAVGSAIGLGVLWKFPYTVGQNGGGLFLLTFIVCVVLIGIPVFVAELMLGRSTARAAIGAFSEHCGARTGWKLGGWLGVISSFLIMSFYSVIAGYGLSYILMSLCSFAKGLSAAEVVGVYRNLSGSGDISVLWHLIFTLITMTIVFSGVRKGIEFWSRIMTRGLFFILLLLLMYSCTLDGFSEACRFVFYPDLARFKFSSILEALGLAFFTLSLGQGIMISYGSYMRKGDSLPEMAGIVGGAVILVSILAALTIFPVVFTFGFTPAAGPGLIFETLPFLFEQLPGAVILATIFFVLFVFTALTSAVAFIEVVSTNLMEICGFERHKAVKIVSLCTFLFGVPSALAASGGLFPDWSGIYGRNFLETIDFIVSVWLIPLGGLVTSLFVGWVMPIELLKEEFLSGTRYRSLWHIWILFMRFVVPVLVILILLQKSGMVDFDRLLQG